MACTLLDSDRDRKAPGQDVRAAVLNIFRERSNLALQLKDTKTVVGRLQTVIGVALHVLAVFVYLMIFNVDIRKTWLLFSSIILAFAFVFGNSLKTVFESVLFLFVIHPFEVGDYLVVDGDTHTVEEISLSVSVMRRADGARLWYPNSKLASSAIVNLSRSESKSERFKFLVDISTPASVLDLLGKAVAAHCQRHASEFEPSRSVVFRDTDNPLKVLLTVNFAFSHPGTGSIAIFLATCAASLLGNGSGVDSGRCSRARSALLVTVCKSLVELGVSFDRPAPAANPSAAASKQEASSNVKDNTPAK